MNQTNSSKTGRDDAVVHDFRNGYGAGKVNRNSPAAVKRFRDIIYGHYREFKRDFPWRRTDNPYHILVSEIMLQQTQTGRVVQKYQEFVSAFPTMEALARAPLSRVLGVWQGLGYNRRARCLHELAKRVMSEYDGSIPDTPEKLVLLPGIGGATAAAICAFAFNRPVAFIETNIRSVFIHFFFPGRKEVSDDDILPLVEASLDSEEPRLWYSALMDYGAMLKKRHPNLSRRSVHHQKQTPFEGSRRQIRGLLLRMVLDDPGVTIKRLVLRTGVPADELHPIVEELIKEGLLRGQGRGFTV